MDKNDSRNHPGPDAGGGQNGELDRLELQPAPRRTEPPPVRSGLTAPPAPTGPIIPPRSEPPVNGAADAAGEEPVAAKNGGGAPDRVEQPEDEYFTWQPRGSRVTVRILRSVLRAVHDHTVSTLQGSQSAEVGGIFFGYHEDGETAQTYVVTIDFAERVESNSSSAVEFVFPGPAIKDIKDRLARLNQQSERQYEVVGWYHSHPEHELYLSSADQATYHRNFREPFSVAMVVQPRRKHAVFFPLEDREQHPNYMTPRGVFHLLDPSKPIGYAPGGRQTTPPGAPSRRPGAGESVGLGMIGPKPPEGRVPTHRELQPRTLKNAIKRNWRIVVPGALGLFLVLLILTVWKLNWIFPPPPGIVMDDVVEDPQTQLYTVTWRGQSAVDKDDFRQATLAVDYIDWKVPPQQFELSYSDFASGQFRSTAPALKPGKVQITLSLAMKRVDEAKYSLIALLGKQAEARGVLSFADGALKWEVSLTTEEQAGIVDGTISVTGPTACRIQLSPKMVLSLHYPLANNPSCPGFQNPSRIELIVALGSSFPYYFRPNAWIPEQRRAAAAPHPPAKKPPKPLPNTNPNIPPPPSSGGNNNKPLPANNANPVKPGEQKPCTGAEC